MQILCRSITFTLKSYTFIPYLKRFILKNELMDIKRHFSANTLCGNCL